MAHRTRKSAARKPKSRYRVRNWHEYNRALVGRGSITLWIDEAVLTGWRAAGGKGLRYSDAAILCALSLRAVFGLTLRQTQGFLCDLTRLLGLAVEVPHYSTFSRRAAVLTVPKLARPARSDAGGPLHLAIDSPGSRCMARASGRSACTARTSAGSGASCTWPWTPGPASCTPMP
jgi:hypothetical protein